MPTFLLLNNKAGSNQCLRLRYYDVHLDSIIMLTESRGHRKVSDRRKDDIVISGAVKDWYTYMYA